jgi:uncharacterized protein YjiS (DUF1127 family)
MFKTFSLWLKALHESIQITQQVRADSWILNNMSERELRDIGTSRGEIREHINGKKSIRKTNQVS